jgi:hypothetical protein
MGVLQIGLGCMWVGQEDAIHMHNTLFLSQTKTHFDLPMCFVFILVTSEFSFISDGASDSSSDTEDLKLFV